MGMRGDVALRLRLLTRPVGLIGVLGLMAAVAAGLAAYLPWYEVSAEVAMMDTRRARTVADLAGWQAHPWGWLLPAIAVGAAVVAVRLAVDRPWARTTELLLTAGLGIAGMVAVGGLAFPPVSRFDVGGSRLRELAALADRLPRDVDMSFSVHPGAGMWVALGSAALLLAVAAATRQLS